MMQYLLLTLMTFFTLTPMAFAKDYTPQQCPVVGNTNSMIYHQAGGQSYAKMLRENQSGDNRKCFKSAQQAQSAGYRASKR